jgi:hypothetical protein
MPPQGRVPFPVRPKSEAHTGDPGPMPGAAAMPPEDKQAESFAPTLRNPDESAVTVEDEISLSPRHPLAPAAQAGNDVTGLARPSSGLALGGAGSSMVDKNREPTTDWRSPAPPPPPQMRPLHPANFDAMWPAEAKLPKTSSVNEAEAEAKADTSSRDALAVSKRGEPEAQKPRTAAVLKSGVVDGMGYTLYVDGSIEAELPQGTLRFASINELRSHLAKNS